MRAMIGLGALLIAACASVAATPPGSVVARIGQTVNVGGPRVTPLALLEDSRCPQGAQCVWAGRVRISARVTLGSGATVHELELGKPIPVADGALSLVAVTPAKGMEQATPAPGYRFAFRFDGGL